MNKYHNKKYVVDGIKFDSVAEAEYYGYLLAEMMAGKVSKIALQPVIELQPAFRDRNGKYIRAITYTPDFHVRYTDGTEKYIDVKGMSTQQGELKRKIYMYQHKDGIPILWVAKSRKYSPAGWIDWFELQKIRRRNRRRK